jgi:hypothetical protein
MEMAIAIDIYYNWTNARAFSWTQHNIATYKKY